MIGLKMFQCPKELAEEHYKDLSSKPFFPDLVLRAAAFGHADTFA